MLELLNAAIYVIGFATIGWGYRLAHDRLSVWQLNINPTYFQGPQ